VDRDTDNRLAHAWSIGICALLYTCALDWDHIWVWLLDTVPPVVLYTEGRPFHTVGVFLLYAVVVSLGLTALIVRRGEVVRKW